MTPKEKAEELVDKFIQTNGNAFFAKECVLIILDEMIDNLSCLHKPEYCTFNAITFNKYKFQEEDEYETLDGYQMIEYWEQVKQEIEKL